MATRKYIVTVNDYKFACLIEDLLSKAGYESVASGMDLFTKVRDLEYDYFEIPEDAEFIPRPLEVNLPEIGDGKGLPDGDDEDYVMAR